MRLAAAVGPVNPVAPALSFGVMTEGDATVISAENDGTMAVGGDLRFGTYQLALNSSGSFVAPGDTVPTSLVVGGRVDFAGSVPGSRLQVLRSTYAKVGDLTGTVVRDTDNNGAQVNTRILPNADYNATPRVELTTRQAPSSVGPTSPIDFAAAFESFRGTANDLATCDNTVVLRTPNGDELPRPIPPGSNAVVTLAPGETNVLNLSATDLNNIAILTFADQPTASTPLLVNVDTTGVGDDFTWNAGNFAGVGGEQARYILFNFPTATRITLPGSSATIEGTIYAPSADLVDLSASNTEGSIITRTFEHRGGEVHYFPFDTTLSCGGDATPSITVVKSSTTTEITEVGQEVPYRFLVTNTGGVTLSEVSVTDVQAPPASNDDLGPVTCAATVLAPGENTTCTATYTVAQADLDNGGVTDTATASGTPPGTTTPVVSPPSTLTIPGGEPTSSIAVVKSVTPTVVAAAGDTLAYRFQVTNTGDTPLNEVRVGETAFSGTGELSAVTCGAPPVPNGSVTLAPGGSVTCTATYRVTAADVAAGRITNTATATGVPPSGPAPVSPESTATVRVQGKLPVTGGSLLLPLVAAALVALTVGTTLLLAGRRRTAR
ncbi:conserved repeat domain-containing protein/choice-of-anchor A domain-containing protein [Micromonospora nigra]|uniref:Conserved repeat domain-containing protein/choice-of-anchor A domain-containing protein n=2 Tax=Micromonospora nigra TaxID=145857 RepID=A0A1C6SST1_9ACTN|nr:conserved repeat domain-containing protein/choice-of-anchor A domain-containing protein [Micromonospora nigra]